MTFKQVGAAPSHALSRPLPQALRGCVCACRMRPLVVDPLPSRACACTCEPMSMCACVAACVSPLCDVPGVRRAAGSRGRGERGHAGRAVLLCGAAGARQPGRRAAFGAHVRSQRHPVQFCRVTPAYGPWRGSRFPPNSPPPLPHPSPPPCPDPSSWVHASPLAAPALMSAKACVVLVRAVARGRAQPSVCYADCLARFCGHLCRSAVACCPFTLPPPLQRFFHAACPRFCCCSVPPTSKHPLQFGRILFCNVLGVPERKEWKACAKSEDEEKAMAQAFRKAFAPFDFTRKKRPAAPAAPAAS
jgi:hypothetical protein